MVRGAKRVEGAVQDGLSALGVELLLDLTLWLHLALSRATRGHGRLPEHDGLLHDGRFLRHRRLIADWELLRPRRVLPDQPLLHYRSHLFVRWPAPTRAPPPAPPPP